MTKKTPYGCSSENSFFLDRDVIKLRRREKLHKIVHGKRKCLMCDRKFKTPDMKKIRICTNCKMRGKYRYA